MGNVRLVAREPCFAFNEEKQNCKALDHKDALMDCNTCRFYKTKMEYERGLEKSCITRERLKYR